MRHESVLAQQIICLPLFASTFFISRGAISISATDDCSARVTSRRHRLQSGQQLHQLFGIYWFDEVVVESRFVREASIFFLPPSGDGDKDNVLSPRLGSDIATGLVSVQLRQANI